MIGDIVGRPGRNALLQYLPELVQTEQVDFVIVNGENAAGGLGITPELADELFDAGADVITTGNHITRKPEINGYLQRSNRLLRPVNFGEKVPGVGVTLLIKDDIRYGVINLQGTVFMDQLPNPFTAADEVLDLLVREADVIVVDFHAEATSEKVAMGHYLDGRVTAVIGTHTHVQTNDARILGGGTAYLTDVGMTGPAHSIIGVDIERSMSRFVTGKYTRFILSKSDGQLNACLVVADPESGHATAVKAINIQP